MGDLYSIDADLTKAQKSSRNDYDNNNYNSRFTWVLNANV